MTCHQLHEIIQYLFILLLKYHPIATLGCELFVIKFIVNLAFSPQKNKTIWINRNATQSPLSEWKINAKANINFMIKILQTDVIVIWFVSLKQYNKWMFK